MKSILWLFISIICGYLYVSWLPNPNSMNVNNIILVFVLNPVKVFAATITFIIGFITNGIFFRETIQMLKVISKTMDRSIFQVLINSLLYIITSFFLFNIGFWQMSLFFSFSILYGMMTIEKNK